jgi:hypothetical protein
MLLVGTIFFACMAVFQYGTMPLYTKVLLIISGIGILCSYGFGDFEE